MFSSSKTYIVQTGKENTPALSLYKKHGFIEVQNIVLPDGVILTSLKRQKTINSLTNLIIYVIFYSIKPFAESKFWSGEPLCSYATWGESFLSRELSLPESDS